MALSIKNDEVDALARELSRLTGESITEAILVALKERLARQAATIDARSLEDRIKSIGRSCAALPRLDLRTDEEILGYDDSGLP